MCDCIPCYKLPGAGLAHHSHPPSTLRHTCTFHVRTLRSGNSHRQWCTGRRNGKIRETVPIKQCWVKTQPSNATHNTHGCQSTHPQSQPQVRSSQAPQAITSQVIHKPSTINPQVITGHPTPTHPTQIGGMAHKYHQMASPSHSSTLRYQKWPGDNTFYCGGRFIGGPSIGLLHCAITMILVIGGLFLGFVCPYLVERLPGGFMIVVVFCYLFVFCLVCLLKTSFSDPGIIPRAKDWDKKKDPEKASEEQKIGLKVESRGIGGIQEEIQEEKEEIREYRPAEISGYPPYYHKPKTKEEEEIKEIKDRRDTQVELRGYPPHYHQPNTEEEIKEIKEEIKEGKEEIKEEKKTQITQPPPFYYKPKEIIFKEVTIDGVVVKMKFCDTCKIYRPPRTSHCGTCNNCFENFDHHCIWVGNCVAKNNYKYFILFVNSVTILCIWVFAFSLAKLVMLYYDHGRNGLKSLGDALKDGPVCLVLVVFCFISVWSVGGLSSFHFYLTSTNLTTNEEIKRGTAENNLFNRGKWLNFARVYCAPTYTSYVNFREPMPEQMVPV
eukprot:Phypoly_transcript_02522.p1 GENE.Phypoly_transcript_02522~~Phypoly_transcript_02522.p1  ORF type:complete len:551 (+),score=76.14 Phypoly_transcript_02522:1080-2732(+)